MTRQRRDNGLICVLRNIWQTDIRSVVEEKENSSEDKCKKIAPDARK